MKWESAPPFEFEINGKTYTVTPIGEREYTEYLNWQTIIAGEKEAPGPAEEGPMLLGADVYDSMVGDKVPAAAIRRAMLTVITDLRMNREAAEQVWERGLSPELLAPTTSGADSAQGSTRSNSTGEANETQKPASTTTTSSRKRTKRTGKSRAGSQSST